ncbi:hypothetical protein GKO46_14155 [SAR202 cluster bacterium JH702]|uniref:Uncharacterized protein n=1 Tax=Candidatus Lucifugimonas marina TaxID=3038979 RepID=A0ABD4XVP5_9CHLR|nr:hypothetical protein [SAR202 cluster bacterium JH702]MDG0870979.1 hypothetical protein [SAR202 cluster bacterium JH639]
MPRDQAVWFRPFTKIELPNHSLSSSAAFVLTRGWRLFSANGPSTEELALIGLRKYLTPKRIGEIQFPDGALAFSAPNLVYKHEELGFAPNQFLTFTPVNDSDRLIVLNVEIRSDSQQQRTIPMSEFRLHHSHGGRVLPMEGVQLTESLKDSSFISSLDARQPLLTGGIELEPESSVLGFVVFAVPVESSIEGISHVSAPDVLSRF